MGTDGVSCSLQLIGENQAGKSRLKKPEEDEKDPYLTEIPRYELINNIFTVIDPGIMDQLTAGKRKLNCSNPNSLTEPQSAPTDSRLEWEE
ncbi:hypothetical protein P9112_012399 [Eukaryota sp. TZLM1-RC]